VIRPRWQKVFSDLWNNPTRTILVIASISVGLFAIGIIANLYFVLRQDMKNSYSAVNPANIYFQTTLLNQDMVDHIGHMPGVAQTEGVRSFSLRVLNARGQWEGITINAYHDAVTPQIGQLHLLEGRLPEKDEIVLDQHKMSDLDVHTGDMLQVKLPSEKIHAFRLSGVVQDLTIGAFTGGGSGFFTAPVQGYIIQDTLERMEQTQPSLFSGLYVTAAENGSDLDAVQVLSDRLSHELEINGSDVQNSKIVSSSNHPNVALIEAIVGVLVVLGLFSVFLSGFLVTNTLQALLTQQTQQIGIMKSIGATRTQVIEVYMTLILFFGVLAFLIAAPLSFEIAFALLQFLARTLNFVLAGQRLIPQALFFQAVLALGMPALAAWLPVQQGTSISVREALSGIRQKHVQAHAAAAPKKATARRFSAWARRLSRPLLISIRNTFRHKGRLALTLLTLSLGGGLFIATFNVQASMAQYIKRIGQYFLADVNVTLQRPYRTTEILPILYSQPDVARVEPWIVTMGELILENGFTGDRVQLNAPPLGSQLVKPIMITGRWIRAGDRDEIVLNELFQIKHPELHVGSVVRLKINGRDTDWNVIGFFQMAGKNGGFNAYTNFDYMAEVIGRSNVVTTYRVVSKRPNLTAAQQEQLGHQIEDRLIANGVNIADLNTGAFITNLSSGGLGVLNSFLLFMALLTALVGSIGLAGTMSMNVMERTREIGILRAIGASDKVLMEMVLVEGLIIGAISYIIGAVLSFPIGKLLNDGVNQAIFGSASVFEITPTGFLIWLLVVMILSFLASVIPARSASRLTIREVLAYE
jgi:putative ABC transport system permease protein